MFKHSRYYDIDFRDLDYGDAKEFLKSLKITDKDKSKGIVYVIQYGDERLYKIGRTRNLVNRFKKLQTQCEKPIRVKKLLFVDDFVVIENYLHKEFKKYRLTGEWYYVPAFSIIENGIKESLGLLN